MRPSLLSSGWESSLLLVKLTFLVLSTIQWVTLSTHTQVKATHIAKKDSSSSVCWWVTLTCLSLTIYLFILKFVATYFLLPFLMSVASSRESTDYCSLTTNIILYTGIGPRGSSGVLALIVASLTSQTNCNQYYSQLHYKVDPTKMGHRGKMGHYS